MVPQGGNTGLCGGATPDASGRSVVISLSRMNRIRAIDPRGATLTAEAGCILCDVHRAAEAADRLFPLDLGSEGSCRIGGTISTNAGGTSVLRYGNMRDLVLGLEAVLPDGSVLEGLRGLRKDNAGYDLKQLFIGAEGTLGIVTAAVLKLFPRPASHSVAVAALADLDAMLTLFDRCRSACGDRLVAFEAMSAAQLDAVVRTLPGARRPLNGGEPWLVILRLADLERPRDSEPMLETVLAGAAETGLIADATIARSEAEAAAFWRLRHGVGEANARLGRVLAHDTSVPIARIPDFVARCDAAVGRELPDAIVHHVGHVGDGNIHVIVIFPRERWPDEAAFSRDARRAGDIVNGLAHDLGGSIAAEHGVGQSLRDQLPRYRSGTELALMRMLKRALDPENLMNPGKVIAAGD